MTDSVPGTGSPISHGKAGPATAKTLSQPHSVPQLVCPSPASPFSAFREKDRESQGMLSSQGRAWLGESLPAGDASGVLSLQAPRAPHPSEVQLGVGTRGEGPPTSLLAPGDALALWRMGIGILSDAMQKICSFPAEEVCCIQAWTWAHATMTWHCQQGGTTGKPPSTVTWARLRFRMIWSPSGWPCEQQGYLGQRGQGLWEPQSRAGPPAGAWRCR